MTLAEILEAPLRKTEFDESKHPRSASGQFGSGGGGGSKPAGSHATSRKPTRAAISSAADYVHLFVQEGKHDKASETLTRMPQARAAVEELAEKKSPARRKAMTAFLAAHDAKAAGGSSSATPKGDSSSPALATHNAAVAFNEHTHSCKDCKLGRTGQRYGGDPSDEDDEDRDWDDGDPGQCPKADKLEAAHYREVERNPATKGQLLGSEEGDDGIRFIPTEHPAGGEKWTHRTRTFRKSRTPMTTAAQLFEHRGPTAGDVLSKAAPSDVVAPSASGDRLAGSFEHFVDKVRDPVVAATPCPKHNGSANGEQYHYPNVKGTFADHAIVGCDSCKKSWHVPFGIGDEDEIKTGEPSERVAAYVAPGGSEADDDGGDAETS